LRQKKDAIGDIVFCHTQAYSFSKPAAVTSYNDNLIFQFYVCPPKNSTVFNAFSDCILNVFACE